MATLKEIEERVEKLRGKLLAVLQMTDAQEIMDEAERLKIEAADLEKDGKEWAAKMEGQARSPKGKFEVVLTEEQQQRIRQATGVHMRSVYIEDTSGRLNAAMPGTSRLQVEKIALEQARQQKVRDEAERSARAQAEENLAVLEAQGGQMAELLEIVKEDPEFRRVLFLDKK